MSSLFVVDSSATSEAAGVLQALNAAQDNSAGVPSASPAAGPQEEGGEMVSEDVEGLIPLCAQHPSGPHQSTATFGYDINVMKQRPWAQPGAKLSDYFNYGFNERSWRLYCRLQSEGRESLLQRANEVLEELQAVTSGGYGPPPNMPGEVHGGPQGVYRGGPNPHMPPPPDGMGGPSAGGVRGGPRGGEGGGYYEPRPQHSRYKTQLCQRFMEGRCTHGASCNYAHGEAELRLAPEEGGVHYGVPPPHRGGGYGRGGGGEGGGGYRGKRYRDQESSF